MGLGLTQKQLDEIYVQGKTREERVKSLYGDSTDFTDMLTTYVSNVKERTIQMIILNNERITKQLRDVGINLPD